MLLSNEYKIAKQRQLSQNPEIYRQIYNIRRTSVGNKIVNNSDVLIYKTKCNW